MLTTPPRWPRTWVARSSLRWRRAAFALLLTVTAGTPILHAFAPRFDVPSRFLVWAIITAASAQFLQYKLIVFQSQGKPKLYVFLSVASFILTASFAVGLVVFAHQGASGMLLGKLAASLVGLVVTLFLFSNALRAPFHWRFVRETLAIGLPLVPHQLMAGGLMVADRFILGYYRDLSEVGLYSIAYTFGGVMSLVTLSLTQAWAPAYYGLARKEEAGRRAMGRICSELVVVLSAIACFGALSPRISSPTSSTTVIWPQDASSPGSSARILHTPSSACSAWR